MTPPEQRRIKLATKRLVRACGGVEAAAEIVRKGKSTVHRWTDVNDAEHFVNLADAAELEAVAGVQPVTELLCQLAGGVFVPHVPAGADEGSLPALVMGLTVEIGEVALSVQQSLPDGVVDAAEAAAILAEIDDLDRKSAQLRAAVRAQVSLVGGSGAELVDFRSGEAVR